ncbi:MAG: hypothetical protein ACOC1K_05945 [Nanoarchaeota archaeon]
MKEKVYCERCGKILPKGGNYTYNFELGFKEIGLDLCNECAPVIRERHKNISEEYKKKLLKLYNKFQTKLLK